LWFFFCSCGDGLGGGWGGLRLWVWVEGGEFLFFSPFFLTGGLPPPICFWGWVSGGLVIGLRPLGFWLWGGSCGGGARQTKSNYKTTILKVPQVAHRVNNTLQGGGAAGKKQTKTRRKGGPGGWEPTPVWWSGGGGWGPPGVPPTPPNVVNTHQKPKRWSPIV